jgi:general secretion pathway protein D
MSWPDTFTWLVPDPTKITLDQLPFGQRGSRDRIGVNASMALKMRQDNSIANLLSNPRIRVKNRDRARILVGDRVPIITATVTPGALNPVTTESISYLDVGLKLETEPTVLLDDDVSIKVTLEVSTLGERVETKSGSVAYRVGTRTVATSLRLKDGETQVLMGLIRDEERNSASGLPGLVDLPLLGRLFSIPHDQKDKTEIVLSITPRIIRNVRRPQAHEMEFWSGTEASMKSRQRILRSTPAGAAVSLPSALPPVQLAAPAAGAAETLAASASAQPAAAKSAAILPLQLSWNAPQGARVGEQFVVAMVANAPSPLLSAALSLKFDPNALEVVTVEEGELLKQAGTPTQFNHTVDAVRGRLSVDVARAGSGGAQGQGRLFNVTFRVKAESAKSQIQMTSMTPVGPDHAAVPFSASSPLLLSLKP